MWLGSERPIDTAQMRVSLEALDQPIIFTDASAVALQIEEKPDITYSVLSETYKYPQSSLDGINYTMLTSKDTTHKVKLDANVRAVSANAESPRTRCCICSKSHLKY